MSNKLDEQLADLSTECESLKSQLIHYKKEIEIHKSEISSLKETNEELSNKYNSSTEQIQQLMGQLNCFNDSNTKFDETNAKNIGLNKENIELKQHIKHYESENEKLLEQIDEYKLKSVHNIRLSASKTQLIDNHKQVELSQNCEIKELKDEIEILNSELTVLKSIPFDDEEETHCINTGYLPALMQNDTLKVKVRVTTPMDDKYSNRLYQRQNSNVSTTSVVTPVKTYNHMLGYNQFSPLSDDGNNITPVGNIGTMHEEQSIVSTTSNVGGTVILNGYYDNIYNIATVLQQKDKEYQSLIEKQQSEFENKIQKLKEGYDNKDLRNETLNLKRQNKMLRERLKNAWEFRCITPSWFNNNIDDNE